MIPQEKTSALVEKLNLMLRSKPSEFELAGIRAEITKIESSGLYTDAQHLRGILSAIVGDIPSLKKHYDAAIKSSGGDVEIKLSYATSLINAFQFKDASELADELIDTFPDDIGRLTVLFNIYSAAFNFKSAANIESKLNKLGALHEKKPTREKIELNNHIETILSDNEVSWEDVCDRSLVVVDLLKKHGLKLYPVSRVVDDESVSVKFPLDVDLAELIQFDSLITEAISKLPYSRVDECVSFTCITRLADKKIAA